MSCGFIRLYHYLLLQPLSIVSIDVVICKNRFICFSQPNFFKLVKLTLVNINNMICPAISDPFKGEWYRVAANIHQTIFHIIQGKLITIVGNTFFAPKESSETTPTTDANEFLNRVKPLITQVNRVKKVK
jgi:hypothetical protein